MASSSLPLILKECYKDIEILPDGKKATCKICGVAKKGTKSTSSNFRGHIQKVHQEE